MLPQSDDVLDGYQLIRLIGKGGFGQVWLCRSGVLDQLFAVKVIPIESTGRGLRELTALQALKRANVTNPHLMPVEHVGLRETFIFCVMPLSDGTPGLEPPHPDWKPRTLGRKICEQRKSDAWFSAAEIRDWFRSLAEAVSALDASGLVHRDIKPDNILFLQGRLVLSDISLLRADAAEMTEMGTPGYRAPSWYIESGGRADMYGLVATLYTALTGNAPDKIGRTAFQWPPQGKSSLTADEVPVWAQLHQVILRALDGRASERYLNYEAFSRALDGEVHASFPLITGKGVWVPVALVVVAAAFVGFFFHLKRASDALPVASALRGADAVNREVHVPGTPHSPGTTARRESVNLTDEQRADYTALATMVALYFDREEYQSSLESIDLLLATYPIANTNPAYSTYRAQNLYHLNRREEALVELRKGLDAKIDMVSLGRRMELWEKLGDLPGAEAEISRVIEHWHPITMHYLYRIKFRLLRKNYAGVDEDIAAASRLDDDPARKSWAATAHQSYAADNPGYAAYLSAKQKETRVIQD